VQITRNRFLAIIAIVTIARIVLSLWIPIKNDEAYYVQWARHLDYGYYDHPPMIGWLLWLMSWVSDSLIWYRMIPLGAGLVATWIAYRLTKDAYGENQARFAAVLFALSPSNLWLVFFSNDGPLLIFLMISVLFFQRATKEERNSLALVSGLFLGLAFLTKYLAVIVGIGYLVFALLKDRKKRLIQVGLVVVGVLPFALQHLYYNYYHCWETFNFHLFIRNADTHFGIGNFLGYLVGLLLVLTPWAVWVFLRHRKKFPTPGDSPLITIIWVSVAVFGLISLKSIIGLHFLLVFSPLIYVYVAAAVDRPALQGRLFLASSIYAVFMVGVLVAVLLLPLERLKGWDQHSNFVVGLAPDKVCQPLEKYASLPLFTNYYAEAGILSYTCKQDIGVLFGWSNYGRQMDAFVDVRELDGKEIAIFELGALDPGKYRDYFSSYRVDHFSVHGAPFSVIVGRNFKYDLYKQQILSKLKSMYYSPPGWLPSAGCPFKDKYSLD